MLYLCVCGGGRGEGGVCVCVGVNGAAERFLYEYVLSLYLSLPSSNKREAMRHPPLLCHHPSLALKRKKAKKKEGKEDDET